MALGILLNIFIHLSLYLLDIKKNGELEDRSWYGGKGTSMEITNRMFKYCWNTPLHWLFWVYITWWIVFIFIL